MRSIASDISLDRHGFALIQHRTQIDDLWDEDAAERYDDTESAMFSPRVLDPAVDFLARLAGSGAALEFAHSAFSHACAVCDWDPALAASAQGTPPPVV